MTGKRFTIGDRALQEVYGGCIPAILDGGIPCTQSEVLKLLNELHEEKQSVIDWIDNKIEEIKPYNSELCRATLLELKEFLE
jgi:hypothetical protein